MSSSSPPKTPYSTPITPVRKVRHAPGLGSRRKSTTAIPIPLSSSMSGDNNGGSDGAAAAAGGSPRSSRSLEKQLQEAKDAILHEKAGKRKLFHSLVKVANELRRTRMESMALLEEAQYKDKNWYEGGLWRAPEILPGVSTRTQKTSRLREAISLSDLFFSLVTVTAFTRTGLAISQDGYISLASFLYFYVFWTVWSKEASYSTRFDTTDLSAQVVTLVTCFAVLFASLSVQSDLNSVDGTRIMIMAAFIAALHCLLHIRVAVTMHRGLLEQEYIRTHPNSTLLPGEQIVPLNDGTTNNQHTNSAMEHSASGTSLPSISGSTIMAAMDMPQPADTGTLLVKHVMTYAMFNILMNALECITWVIGFTVFDHTSNLARPIIFSLACLFGLRVPRAFLANDFHAACSKRGVLFILLLGFLLQNIVVVAGEFFAYQTPTIGHYFFLGAACLMFFCIKLLYVDDSDTLAEDHALLVNRTAGFFFNVGQFTLLLSTVVMGSGMNLLTHDYMAATAALPSSAKNLVCGGFSAVLFSTFFIKSMHLKRVPTDSRNQALFVSAFIVQTVVLLAVVCATALMCLNHVGGFLEVLMQNDIKLLFCLSGSALFVVLMQWLDEGIELALYGSAADSRQFRIHPFGFWWCLKPEVTEEEVQDTVEPARRSLSALSPLLGTSVANLKDLMGYESMAASVSFNRNSRSTGSLPMFKD